MKTQDTIRRLAMLLIGGLVEIGFTMVGYLLPLGRESCACRVMIVIFITRELILARVGQERPVVVWLLLAEKTYVFHVVIINMRVGLVVPLESVIKERTIVGTTTIRVAIVVLVNTNIRIINNWLIVIFARRGRTRIKGDNTVVTLVEVVHTKIGQVKQVVRTVRQTHTALPALLPITTIQMIVGLVLNPLVLTQRTLL